MYGKILYLVWWKGYLKRDATYEPRSELIKDVPDMIKEFEKSQTQTFG